MVFKCDRCEICGSNEIVELVEYEKDGNTFYGYQCRSCFGEFNSESKLRVLNLKNAPKTAVKKAKAVVEIEKEENLNVFDKNRESVVIVGATYGDEISTGSGFVCMDGYILTNLHCVGKVSADKKIEIISNFIYCKFYKQSQMYTLEFVTADPKKDLALLKIEAENLKPVEFSTKPVKTGEHIYAIGNSAGKGICIIDGLVSDELRKVNDEDFIVITANTLPGNSGGPLIDDSGNVVGVVVADSGKIGINYAIPLDIVKEFLERAREEIAE